MKNKIEKRFLSRTLQFFRTVWMVHGVQEGARKCVLYLSDAKFKNFKNENRKKIT